MDQEKIGKAAGAVWSHLQGQRDMGASLSSLKKIDGVKADEAVAAVGWLAREGKIRFEADKRNRVTICLVETELAPASMV